MTDAQHYAYLNEFANAQSVAKGGKIRVEISPCLTSMKPIGDSVGFNYEDSQYLGELIRGASSFLFWLRRNGYEIRKGA